MGSASGWDNMAAMTEGTGPEETEAVGKRTVCSGGKRG